jgi:hypothetical protein
MKTTQLPHHSVHIVQVHVILVKLPPNVTLVLPVGTYMEILVSKIVMNHLDYITTMMTELVQVVTNLVKLVMNHIQTQMNVLHAHQILIVMKEPIVNLISQLVSLLEPPVLEILLQSPE